MCECDLCESTCEREKRDLCLKIADGGGDGGVGAKDTSSLARSADGAGSVIAAWVNERVKRDR